MEDIIRSQTKDLDSSEVYELILEKYRGSSISQADSILLSKFSNIESLSFIMCGLKSLENFPVLSSLIKLDLGDNKLKSGFRILASLTSLTHLSLAGNQIADIKELACLTGLDSLVTLDLFGNPLTETSGYREEVFGMFRNLQVLDGCDKDGEEVSVNSEEESESEEEESDISGFIERSDEEEPGKRERSEDRSLEECKKLESEE